LADDVGGGEEGTEKEDGDYDVGALAADGGDADEAEEDEEEEEDGELEDEAEAEGEGEGYLYDAVYLHHRLDGGGAHAVGKLHQQGEDEEEGAEGAADEEESDGAKEMVAQMKAMRDAGSTLPEIAQAFDTDVKTVVGLIKN